MSHNEEKLVAFQVGDEVVKNMLAGGVARYFQKEFPDLARAFSGHTACVACMDEGTMHKDMEEGDKLALAGSGILFPAADEAERLSKVADLMIERGVEVITSHGGCGAAGLAYKRDFTGIEPAAPEIENYAIAWSKKLTEKIQEKQHAAEHVHIAVSEMERPAEFHNARVAYFDGVGGFNPNKEKGLPMGFVIERKFVPAGYAAAELKVAASIAFGDHGFGALFTADSPFVIVVFANSERELSQLESEVEEVSRDEENFKAGKIKVDGVVVEGK